MRIICIYTSETDPDTLKEISCQYTFWKFISKKELQNGYNWMSKNYVIWLSDGAGRGLHNYFCFLPPQGRDVAHLFLNTQHSPRNTSPNNQKTKHSVNIYKQKHITKSTQNTPKNLSKNTNKTPQNLQKLTK